MSIPRFLSKYTLLVDEQVQAPPEVPLLSLSTCVFERCYLNFANLSSIFNSLIFSLRLVRYTYIVTF